MQKEYQNRIPNIEAELTTRMCFTMAPTVFFRAARLLE